MELDGEGIRSVSLPGGRGQSSFVPTDVAIEGGSVVVADRGGHLLHLCIAPAFDQVRTVGDWGEVGGALNSPYLLDMKYGRIYVTDMMNGRLVQTTERGVFIRGLGERGVREGQFVRPKGVAVGPEEDVFVSDSTLGVVQVFDTEFRYRGTVGSDGRPRHFQHPAGLAVHQDLLAVVEQKRNVVTILRIKGP
jgi:hypothetical protein